MRWDDVFNIFENSFGNAWISCLATWLSCEESCKEHWNIFNLSSSASRTLKALTHDQTSWQARKGTSIWRLYGSAPVLLQSTTGSNLQASPASNRMSMWPGQCRTNSLWRNTSWIKQTRREGSSWNGKGRKGKWRERKEREGKKRKGKERRWGETTATHLRKCMNKHGDTKRRDTQSGWAG